MKPGYRFFGNLAKATAQKVAQETLKKTPSAPALPPGATGWQACSLTGFLIPSYMPVEKPKNDRNENNTSIRKGP